MLRKLFSLLLLAGLVGGCTRIGPGHVGIAVNMAGSQRGVQDLTLKTGWVYYVPGKTAIFEYPTYVQTYVWTKNEKQGINEEFTFTTQNQMVVSLDVNVSYSLEPSKVPAFYVKFRSDDISQFTHGFLRAVARDCFNETGGHYSVEQVMGDNAAFIKEVRACVQGRVINYGINFDQFGIIGAPRPPESIITAINLKAQAQQIALQKQIEVTQAEADARKNVAEANGTAGAVIAKAKGDAIATITNANAQAKANRILAASITREFLEYTKLLQWDGVLPQVTGGQAWVTMPTKTSKQAE